MEPGSDTRTVSPADVLAFWREAGRDKWFTQDDAFDADIREKFLATYEAAAAGKLTLDHRIRLRLATTHGMNEATDVSVACYRAAGTTAIMNSAPFERRFRDAMSASQHLQGMWPHAEMVGRHLIGAENVVQFV
jgi:alkylation response protein AidB-like acyl-CoA dehydrogenase